MDWILGGVLGAVLAAELVDAWALHHLARTCVGIRARSASERRLVQWYAEGFDHSRIVTSWLRAMCLGLTLVCLAMAVHPILAVASLGLAIVAHCERSFSVNLRRRFFRGDSRRSTIPAGRLA